MSANVTIISGDQRHCLCIEDSSGNFQKYYDEALQRGFVSINRSRVIVVGQDGAGKSCLVDSLLVRLFESGEASTEGATVTMTYTAVSGWVATNRKDYLDRLIAEGCYRNLQHSALNASAAESISSADKIDSHSELEEKAEEAKSVQPAEAVGIEAKTLTHNQLILMSSFIAEKPSVEDLRDRTLGVRDMWDLGGQEVYLALTRLSCQTPLGCLYTWL